MGIAEELEKLNELRANGTITEHEYQEAKDAIFAKSPKTSVGDSFKKAIDNVASDENSWGMYIHLSQFCGVIVPGAGFAIPVVLWVLKKDESGVIDEHGLIVINWMITQCVFAVAFSLLCFVLIGFPLLLALVVATIVYPIMGGIKASQGEIWKYPFSIEFIKGPRYE